jgi:RHS repeat-associated protein
MFGKITNGAVTRYQYDAVGNLTDREDAKNEETHYDYDSMNRLTNIVHEGIQQASFGYDQNGNVIGHKEHKNNIEVDLGYDSMNRLTNSSISVHSRSFAVTNSYDLNGNRTNIVYPGGLVVSYAYDAEDRLESVTTKYTNDTKTTSFNYDSASRLTNIVYPNGVNSSFSYDAESRVTSIRHGSFINRVITRDPRGYKTSENIFQGLEPSLAEGEQRFTHNDADQLTHIDQRDTWLGSQLDQWYNRDYSYDANGCLTNEAVTRPEWNTNSAIVEYEMSYQWDYDNRLIETTKDTNHTKYLYDASGARIGRIAGGSPAVTNYFVLDYRAPLKMPLAETDASGNITRYYIWSSHGLLAHLDVNPSTGAITATRYYHSDEQGSTLALTDEVGAVTDQFAYTPYGTATRTGSSDTPFQWLGGYGVYYNSETDLHLTLHRAYSADMRRFISTDPMGIDSFANLYAYGDMNPLFFVDPYGLCADSYFGDVVDVVQGGTAHGGLVYSAVLGVGTSGGVTDPDPSYGVDFGFGWGGGFSLPSSSGDVEHFSITVGLVSYGVTFDLYSGDIVGLDFSFLPIGLPGGVSYSRGTD